MQNYDIFLEPAGPGYYSHVRVYNNVCVNTLGTGSQAMAISFYSACPTDDLVVANNLTDGGFGGGAYTVRQVGTLNSGYVTNSYFVNNISVQGSLNNIIDNAITQASNANVTPAQTASNFATYAAGSASNDYHLKPATPLAGVGFNCSAFFTLDRDGNARSTSGAWDLGPYVYAGSASTLPAAPRGLRVVSP